MRTRERKKICRACRSTISYAADICPNCNSDTSGALGASEITYGGPRHKEDTRMCRHCRGTFYSGAKICPHCRRDTSGAIEITHAELDEVDHFGGVSDQSSPRGETEVFAAILAQLFRILIFFALWMWVIPGKRESLSMFLAMASIVAADLLVPKYLPKLSDYFVLGKIGRIVHWVLVVGTFFSMFS